MELERLSYSKLDTYKTCPEQFRLLYIEDLPDSVGWYHVGGTAVHAMSEQQDIHDYFGGDPPKSFNHYFEQALEEQKLLTPSVPESEYIIKGTGVNTENATWWRNRGPGLVQAWSRWLKASPYMPWVTPDGEPAIEVEVNSVFGGVPSKGFIDRILCEIANPGDPYVVVDLKNGKPPRTKTQLGAYAKACEQRGWDVRYGGYFMTRGGILTGLHDLTPYLDGMIEYEFEQAWRGINNKVFQATPNGLCAKHCGVAKYCAWGGQLTDRSHLPYVEEGRV